MAASSGGAVALVTGAKPGFALEGARQLAGRGMTVEYPVTTEGGRGARKHLGWPAGGKYRRNASTPPPPSTATSWV